MGGIGGGSADLVGPRGGVDDAVGDRVTCAAAGSRCTVLGTRRGRVLAAGLINVSSTASGGSPREFCSALLSEIGRVDGGCWRVQCAPVLVPGVESMLVIDSAGRAHELAEIGDSPLRGSRRRKQRRVVSDGGWGSGGGSSTGGGAFETSSSTEPPRRQLRVAPPFARCSSVLISPAVEGTRFSWAENGSQGYGNAGAYVAVSSDGCLLSSARAGAGETVELKRGDRNGVVHASAWVDFRADGAHGLLVVDGGASVVTHGYGRTGHVSWFRGKESSAWTQAALFVRVLFAVGCGRAFLPLVCMERATKANEPAVCVRVLESPRVWRSENAALTLDHSLALGVWPKSCVYFGGSDYEAAPRRRISCVF